MLTVVSFGCPEAAPEAVGRPAARLPRRPGDRPADPENGRETTVGPPACIGARDERTRAGAGGRGRVQAGAGRPRDAGGPTERTGRRPEPAVVTGGCGPVPAMVRAGTTITRPGHLEWPRRYSW
ncbi:hypothetical protein GCM10018781_71400 [Kitasatospora indigofera]|uniref:Uncharacterized protein n=1 Tax=Kitasatospora indigofera TaxID=67307 RepID=A0A919L3K3_9ACTN|nr:hypothetical protein GCM10018781_71400 [Kitasatospora indigofera]